MMIRVLSRTPGGIRFGDYVFTEPIPLDHLLLPHHSAGVYAILIPDPTWGPRDFQPLFFGEFASGRCSITAMELSLWYRAAAGKRLYGAVLPTPGVHTGQLSGLTRKLIDDYRPICNRGGDGSETMELARRLETLERTNYQHDILLKLAIAAFGQTVYPQIETKKRPAGFITRD